MYCSSYFALLLCVCFIESSLSNDNGLMNAGFMMDNENEELVCSLTCIKKPKPPTSPCDNDGGPTTTTKIPCPLANTTLPPTTALPTTAQTATALPSTVASTTLPSTPPSTPPSTILPTILPSTILPTIPPSTTLPPLSTKTSTPVPPTTTTLPSTTQSTTTLQPSTTCNKTKTVCMNGDPHYTTWDGAYFDYHGTCPYNFVAPCTPNGIPGFENFNVKAQNKLISTNPTPIAVVDSVQFEIYQQKIYISLLGDLYINEQRQYYPYFYPDAANPKITIRQNGWLKTVETASGINLEFNGYTLCVTIPDCGAFYGKDKLCGLSGNYDGNCSNDIVYQNGTKPVELVSCRYGNTVSDWANKHVISDYFYPNNASKECTLGANSNGCNRIIAGSFDKCKPISDSVNGIGIFKQCKAMGPDVIERMFQACAADVCLMKDYLCKSFEDFALECQRIINGTDLGNWRAAASCAAVQCPVNSAFKSCVSSCQPTCTDPTEKPSCPSNICIEGCQCNDGYVIDNAKTAFSCVKVEDCGCFDENTGIYHSSPNDPWITKNCTTFNTCWKGKRIARPYQCDTNEKCVTKAKAESCQSTTCLEGWRYFSKTGGCYKTIYNVNFDQAETQCQTFGSHLTSIASPEENEFVRSMVYIGTTDVPRSDDTYIGLSGFNGFKWTDATPFNYSNGAVYPDAFGVEHKIPRYCWFMLSDNDAPQYSYLQGQWFISNCDRVFRTAICKKV